MGPHGNGSGGTKLQELGAGAVTHIDFLSISEKDRRKRRSLEQVTWLKWRETKSLGDI